MVANSTYYRLCNEWGANYLNESAKEFAKSIGIDDYNDPHINFEKMREVRSLCRKNTVWLKGGDERDLYIEYMPMGGYSKYNDYNDIKHIIRAFHAYEKMYGNLAARRRFLK